MQGLPNNSQWMDEYETTPGVLNIAETCAASISIDDLVALCEDPNIPLPINTSTKLTYGAIRGSPALRERLASLYSARVSSPLSPENILITPGAIAANFLLLYTLIGPGDHVICVHPTYQQLYSVPESLGAEVSLWKLKKEKNYIPDIEDLKPLIKDNTKMIIINNPNNPTGSTIPKSVLTALIELARPKNLIILSDEVYRPLFHGISPMDAVRLPPPPHFPSSANDPELPTLPHLPRLRKHPRNRQHVKSLLPGGYPTRLDRLSIPVSDLRHRIRKRLHDDLRLSTRRRSGKLRAVSFRAAHFTWPKYSAGEN